jgi:viroplasmin and RNaseH domain-containing protein
MAWYVVFRGRKPVVYESWVVYNEYVIGFSSAFFQSNSTRMQAEEAYQAFLKHIVEKGEHVSNKWSWKDRVILVQFIVIVILWYKIM